MDDSQGPRPKRQKKDKFGRFAALEKLRGLKGSKYKYEVDDVDDVYEEVDETEYTKKVLSRQESDWIVNDDGSGYVEDGRDIFDDDMDSESIALASTSKGKGTKRKKKAVSSNAGKGNLQYMLSTMPAKKKEVAGLEDDDLLSELISEIDQPQASTVKETKPNLSRTNSLLAEKTAAKDYMKSFVPSKPRIVKIEETPEPKEEEDKSENAEDKSKNAEEKENIDANRKTVDNEAGIDKEQESEVKIRRPKLLFKVEAPKVQPKKEPEPVIDLQLNLMDFEGDFDFEVPQSNTKPASKKPVEPKITKEQLSSGFTTGENNDVHIQPEFLKDVKKENAGKNTFLFYWWDAFEDKMKHPGTVLLFGKTFSEQHKKYISCCVVVKNIQRKIYLLPRSHFLDVNGDPTDKPVSIMDVYQEFNDDVIRRFHLSTYKSRKVTKGYAFDPSVPLESEYLEVRYEGYIDLHSKTYKTFSRAFGMNSSFLEIFLLERKIKGPCWLTVVNPQVSKNPFTHSAIEVVCSRPHEVCFVQSSKPMVPPPLVVLTLNCKVAAAQAGSYEIALISCVVNNEYHLDKNTPDPPFQDHFCVFTKVADVPFPKNLHVAQSNYKATRVQKMDSERALLNYFITQFSKIDPDLIVGHDLTGYQLSILAGRLLAAGPSNFSRLSRIKRSNSFYLKRSMEQQIFTGRLVCDVKISAKELIRSRAYDLDALCQTVLKIAEGSRIEIEPENVQKMYESATDLFKMFSLTMQDTAYILRIMYELNVIPLALQITNIAGNVMSRTLMGGRSERNEFLLLHAFSEKDYIVPEKEYKKKDEEKESNSKRKKPTYSGGLVLDPKVGFYDTLILLMDFNSLYPSIIQEYNICFTTVTGTSLEDAVLPNKEVPLGILPTEIRKLVESRRDVKNLMKNPDLSPEMRSQYNIRQMALKLTANSMYGCLGFQNSRFTAKNLAALVTLKGREILTDTKCIVQRLNYDVIYGDTDSIMINTNCLDYEQVMKIGKSIKQEINKLYKQVELDIDGVFKYLLLLKKKKYAAVLLEKGKSGQLIEQKEFKGLDIVRRDWSQLAAQAGKFILNQILSDQTADQRIENIQNHLTKLRDDINADKIPLPLLIITKQLTKDPLQYTEKTSLPHVMVAARHNNTRGRKFKAGDTVPYVICKDGTANGATQRAYLLDELKNSDNLTIDCNYYLAQQIHPVVSRICEPIDGIDASQIAECLGIEDKYRKSAEKQPSAAHNLDNDIKKLVLHFRNAEPFVFNCVACKFEIKMDSTRAYGLDKCSNLQCSVRPLEYLGHVGNCLMLQLRNFIKKFYSGELTCEDPGCVGTVIRLPQRFSAFNPICTICFKGVMYKMYTEVDLYQQILYFYNLFNVAKFEKKVLEPNVESAYNSLREIVITFHRHSWFNRIRLSELFDPLTDKLNKEKPKPLYKCIIEDSDDED